MPQDPSIAIVYHSHSGRTKAVAQAIADASGAALIAVDDLAKATDPAWSILDRATTIVMGCPTYMGSVPAPFKIFMDATSQRWGEQRWADKLAAGFTHSAGLSGDKLNVLTTLTIFAAQHGMVWVGMGEAATLKGANRLGSYLGLMTQSDFQGQPPESDLATATAFGKRLAAATERWGGGEMRHA